MSTELTLYADLLDKIKTRIRQAQVKATLSANSKRNIKGMLRFYREYPGTTPIVPQVVAQLIFCQTKDRIIAEYALRDIHKPLGVSDYELTRSLPRKLKSSLPTIEEIETELQSGLGGEFDES
jgi:hypothetical protein